MNRGASAKLANGLTVLLFHCERPQRLGRRVDVIVDTTDSLWTTNGELDPATNAALANIIEALDDGDSLSVWRLGAEEHTRGPIRVAGTHKAELLRRTRAMCTPWRNGSFLAPTLRRLIASSIDPDAIFILSDGALFDDPRDLSVMHELPCASINVGNADPSRSNPFRLEPLASRQISGDAASVRAFLPARDIRTCLALSGWRATLGLRFDAAGEIVVRCEEPWISPPRQDLRIAVIGEPVASGPTAFLAPAHTEVAVDGDATAFVNVIANLEQAFGFRWHQAALDSLLRGTHCDKSVEIQCFHCGSRSNADHLRSDLFCHRCRLLVISTDRVSAQNIQTRFWSGLRFPIYGNSVIARPDPITESANTPTRSTRESFEVYETRDGQWLYTSLTADSY